MSPLRTIFPLSRGETPVAATVAALVAATLAACGPDAPAGGTRADAPGQVDRPNVVVYLCDTLRADHLGSYGASEGSTPFLDELARESAVFENAFSQAPWTLPSVASLMSSSYSTTHGVVANRKRLSPDVVTLAEALRAAGYTTANFTQSPFGGTVTGSHQGFDVLSERPAGEDDPEAAPDRSFNTLEPFLEWIRGQGGERPLFVYLHTVEPHFPLESFHARAGAVYDGEALNEINRDFARFRAWTSQPPAGQRGKSKRALRQQLLAETKVALAEREAEIRAYYRAAVLSADGGVRRVVEALREQGLWEDTVFVFLSDHGEEFLEHDYWLHDQSLHRELLAVPLIVRAPGLTDGGLRVAQPVQVIDVGPTLLELIGAEPPATWQGRSLATHLRGEPPAEAPPVFAVRNNSIKRDGQILRLRGDHEVALIRGRWKLILHSDLDRISLYDWHADPDELVDVSGLHPERAAELRAEVEAWLVAQEAARTAEPVEEDLDPEQFRRLRELGYLAGEEEQPSER